MTLYIEQLLNNPKACVLLSPPPYAIQTYPEYRTIKGLVQEDFGFGMTSDFQTNDSGDTPLAAELRAANKAVGAAQSVIKVIQQTLSNWNGSTRPTFTIPLTLVKYNQSIDIITTVKCLLDGVAPEYSGLRMIAPYHYAIPLGITQIGNQILATGQGVLGNSQGALNNTALATTNVLNGVQNTWAIQYSVWFRAFFLVLKTVTVQFSKQTAKGTNDPLYARVNLEFTPCFLPDASTVNGWFINNTNIGVADFNQNNVSNNVSN
jgi:hypothetical protein